MSDYDNEVFDWSNEYKVRHTKSDTVSKKLQRLVRMLQLEAQGLADKATTDTAIADLRRELDDPGAVVSVIATIESKSV